MGQEYNEKKMFSVHISSILKGGGARVSVLVSYSLWSDFGVSNPTRAPKVLWLSPITILMYRPTFLNMR